VAVLVRIFLAAHHFVLDVKHSVGSDCSNNEISEEPGEVLDDLFGDERR
jgi:hypothetical protein